ncbi:MAG: hypothetical protein ACK4N6_03740 [Rhodocyclaceae bacterium]
MAATAIATSVLLMHAASAQQPSLGPVTGTVRISQIQVAFIGSGQIGGGTLNFRGRKHDITVGGLGFGGVGASKLTARGSVYGLKRLEDFAGPYVQLRQGWALGDQGGGRLWLENSKGVILRLSTQRRGLQMTLGADGVLIGFKN